MGGGNLRKKLAFFGYKYMMTIDEINKKIDIPFEHVLVSDVRDILNTNYPNDFSFYIIPENSYSHNFIDINNELINNEKIYTYVKVVNEEMFNNVNVFVQLKNLINKNVDFKEVPSFIEKLKNTYKEYLDYNNIELWYNKNGYIDSGNFIDKKYNIKFHAKKSQMINSSYILNCFKLREFYSTDVIPIEGIYCDTITGLMRDNNIPVHIKYKGDIFEISTYSYQHKPIPGSYKDELIINEELPYYNGTLNVLKDDKKWWNNDYINFYDNIYYEIGCDTKSIRKISDYLSQCCTIEGAYCFIKKDGTVDLIDNHTKVFPTIELDRTAYNGAYAINRQPIPPYMKFGICEGHFYYCNMGINSLIGCPDIVYGDFNCCKNNLKDLTGIPSEIYGELDISYNPLTNSAVDNVEVDVHSGKINYRGTCIESNYIK